MLCVITDIFWWAERCVGHLSEVDGLGKWPICIVCLGVVVGGGAYV